MRFLKNYPVLVMGLAIVLALFHFGIVYSDSKSYIALARYFLGENSNPPLNTLAIRPLVPLLAAIPSKFLGFPIGFGILNSIFWALGAFMLYEVTRRLYSKNASIYAALMFTTSMPTLLYFGGVMTEAGGFFFSLLPVLLYLSKYPIWTVKGVSAHLLAGIGLLSREVTYLSAASVLLAGIMDGRVRESITRVALMSIPFVVYQTFVSYSQGIIFFNSLIGAGYGYVESKGLVEKVWDPEEIAKAFLLGHYPLSSLFLLVGFLSLDDRRAFRTTIALLVPAVAGFLTWPFRDLRIAIAMYYSTMPLAGYGMEAVIKMLRRKPILEKLNDVHLAVLLIVLQIVLSEFYVLRTFGRFSYPWDIYLFAPSSLRAGLE